MLPFEQSSTSPFGQNNSSNNPFSPKPFGSTTPFGSQTDSSVSGGTSTGVFGAAHTPSPFGASCSPAFGSSMHGSSSTSAFDSSSTSFGGFGQKLAFGGIGIPTSFQKQLEAARKQVEPLKKQQLEAVRIRMQQLQAVRIRKQLEAVDATSTLAIGATRNPAIPMSPTSFPAFVSDNWNDVFSIFSYPTIAEEYGGTSGQTATLESISAKRFDVGVEGL